LTSLDGSIAIITGGTSGIGRAVARLLVADGARVVVSGRSPDRGAEVVSELEQTGAEALFVPADLGSAADAQRLIASCVERFGGLDTLVNCGGVNAREDLDGPTEEDWDLIFTTNVKGTWLCCRAALPHLIKSQGSIVNLGSNSGIVGVAGSPGYSASKAAVINLTKSLALGYADQGVRINAVCPGPVETPMIFGSWNTGVGEEEGRRLAQVMCPMGRIASPTEIAAAVRFLASSAASFITGATLAVDGGKSSGIMRADRYA
jgi:NAD(P)-dependent dehydrogenase (short-subunit alcohol dehydrogenase family)